MRGTAAEVAERFSEPPKGEITLVLGSAQAIEAEETHRRSRRCRARRRGRVARRQRGGARLAAHRRGAQPALPSVISVARFDNSRPPCYRAARVFKIGNRTSLQLLAVVAALALAPAPGLELARRRPGAPGFRRRGRSVLGGQHRGDRRRRRRSAPTCAHPRAAWSRLPVVAGQGSGVTIRTADGYSVTLVHLGSIGVGSGTAVDEGEASAPSARAERSSSRAVCPPRNPGDGRPHGYLDPLSLLPARASQAERRAAPLRPAPAQTSVASGSSSAPARRSRLRRRRRARSELGPRRAGRAVLPVGRPKVTTPHRVEAVASAPVRSAPTWQAARRRPPVAIPAPIARRAAARPRSVRRPVRSPRGARTRRSEQRKPATLGPVSRPGGHSLSAGWLFESVCRSASGSCSSGSSACVRRGSRRGRPVRPAASAYH